jgi:hypothetical protein
MAIARSLVSLFRVFVVFFIFIKIMIKKFTNKETGTISGAPIVAADPVTYVITAYGFYFFDDTATVVIAVGVGTTNLAFGKPDDLTDLFLTT